MVTFEEIIKIDFFKWAQLFVRPPRVPFFSLSQGLSFLRGLNLVNDCSKCHEIRNICTLGFLFEYKTIS